MMVSEIFALGRNCGGHGEHGHGGYESHSRDGGYHESYRGYRESDRYERHSGSLLSISLLS